MTRPTAIICLLALACLTLIAGGCNRINQTDALPTYPDRFMTSGLETVITEQQRADWCWAACTEIALKKEGIRNVSQRDLVTRFKAGSDTQSDTANQLEFLEILAGKPIELDEFSGRGGLQKNYDAPGYLGGGAEALREYAALRDPHVLIADMYSGHVVLLGLKDWQGMPGHIVVARSVLFQRPTSEQVGAKPKVAELDAELKKEQMDAQRAKQERNFWQRMGDAGASMVKLGENLIAPKAEGPSYPVTEIEFFDPRPGVGFKTLRGKEIESHVEFYISRARAKDLVDTWNARYKPAE